MSLFRSAPNGFAAAGWRGVIVSAVFGCLFPSVLGGLVVLVLMLLGTEDMGDARTTAFALASLALISPLLTWVGFALAVPAVAALLRRGWFGWLPALALGLVVGAGLAALTGNVLALGFGPIGFALQRLALGRLHPAAISHGRA